MFSLVGFFGFLLPRCHDHEFAKTGETDLETVGSTRSIILLGLMFSLLGFCYTVIRVEFRPS